MADVFSKEVRSRIMSRIRSSHTSPELVLKAKLKGFEHNPNEFGKPDFVNYPKKSVIFVDGCFWHGCSEHYREPKQNKKYWEQKIKRNISRGYEVNIAYENAGWKVIRIWEHDL